MINDLINIWHLGSATVIQFLATFALNLRRAVNAIVSVPKRQGA
jgi:hypothetical protein